MKKYLSKVFLGLIPLIFFSNSFALVKTQNILNQFIQKFQPNMCNDHVMTTVTDFYYNNLISVKPSLDNASVQNMNSALAILCFNDPYAPELAKNVVVITNPVVQKVTSNLSSSELVFNINNDGNSNHKLLLVKSPEATQIQLQYTIKDKSGALMVKQIKQIPINVDQQLTLSDVGYQIMMINFNPRLRARDQVPLTLVFEDGSKININAQVQCENFYQ